uniref:Fungal lipase-like domain-containing protein n=1 Tax=Leersia perrieri TaxID=77586 RepID=A0A0D9VY46_9ORYZ
MALSCAAECALSLACARWALRRLSLSGADDSASWPAASSSSFTPVPRACRSALAAYDADTEPAATSRRLCPPYRVTHDRERGEVVVAVRGLGLARVDDYRVLLDAGGPEPFPGGGHAHRGLLRAAVWLLDREAPAIGRMVAGGGCTRLVFVGHSLGAGVAALAAVVAVRCWLGRLGLHRGDVRCYAMAPPRCMSLGLALEYADVVHSVVLQDDFLPRTPAPLQHIFGSIFCLPCLLCFICMRDTFVSEEKLKDASKLYAPGRVFHIVERENCRCGRLPPKVRTAVPAEGRFEHVVLSCNTTSDHGIIWIEKEAQKALDLMEQEELTLPPSQQKMLRVQETKSLAEHRLNAMEHVVLIQEGNNSREDDALSSSSSFSSPITSTTSLRSESSLTRSEWDELVETFLHDSEEDGDSGRNMCNSAACCLPCCKWSVA